jgi:hypothetical protein
MAIDYSPFERMMARIDGESRRLPPGRDPDADREYATADAAWRQRARGDDIS